MQLSRLILPALFSVTLLSGCSLFSGEEDIVKMSPLPTVENQFSPQILWQTSVGDGSGDYYINLRPAWQDDVVYSADRNGTVEALDASSGKKRWSVSLAGKGKWLSASQSALLSGGVTVDGSQLFIGSEKAQLYALSTDDGALAWQTTVAGEAVSRPVVSDGLVIVHTSNGLLQALDATNGQIKWTITLNVPSLSLRGESAPAAAFGAAVIGGDNGSVSAVLLQKGQLIWQQNISLAKGATEISRLSDVDMTPVIMDGVVYATAYNGSLAALDLRSGQIIWRQKIGSVHNVVVNGNYIYLVDQNDQLLAISRDSGATVWKQTALLHRNLTAPVLYQNNLVVADAEGYVHWMDSSDGHFVAQQKLDGAGFLADPVLAGDNLLLQAKNGKLYQVAVN